MKKKIKNIISKTDNFFYRFFGSDKSVKSLQNIREAEKIFSCLNQEGKEDNVRFVGGCVRKALCGDELDDIDLATSLEPTEAKRRLTAEDIKVIESGISHGTITAILNDKKFEITTLRKDISTDGRHAEVEFTSNWESDASRRDFTINAIYSDLEGRIFDPLNGVSDLQNGIIKFIGPPEERIKEDYLRILRYFRFFIQYSKTEHDQGVIKSIRKNINGLNKISNERIFDELIKILKIENLYSLFSNNQSKEIILNVFPQFKYYERLEIFNSLSNNLRCEYDNYLILALIIMDESNDYEYFCHKYKVSNNIKNRFKNIALNFNEIKNKKFYLDSNIKKLIYLLGKNNALDLLLFSACENNKRKNFDVAKLIAYVRTCKVPKFPISGEYLKKYGYKSGINLGKKLKSLEEKWIENNFVLDEKLLEKTLNKISQN